MAQSTEKELVYITEEEMANLQNSEKSNKKATIFKKFKNMELSGAFVNSTDKQDSNKHSIQTQTDFVCDNANTEEVIIGDTEKGSIQIHNLQFNGQSFELVTTKKLKSYKNQYENGSLDGTKALNTGEEEKSTIFISDNKSLKLNKTSGHTSLANVQLTSGWSSRLDSLELETECVRDGTCSCDKTATNTHLKMLPIASQNEETVAKFPKGDSNEILSVMDRPKFGKNHRANLVMEQQELGINNSNLVMERQESYLKPHEAVDLRQSNDQFVSEEVIERQSQHHHYEDVDNTSDRRNQNVWLSKRRRIKISIIVCFLNLLIIGSLAMYISFKDYSEQPTSTAGFQEIGGKSVMVAFSVQLYRYWPHPHLNHTRLVYDIVLLNIGSSYNKSDRIFYCRNDGIYVFSVSVAAGVDVHRRPNFMNLIIINKHFPSPVVYFGDSISLFLELNAGDKIWVENPVFNIYHSIFTGHLINDQY